MTMTAETRHKLMTMRVLLRRIIEHDRRQGRDVSIREGMLYDLDQCLRREAPA